MPKCFRMKNKNTCPVISRLFLGFFLLFMSISLVSAEGNDPCNEFSENKSSCESNYECRWSAAYTDTEGEEHDAVCHVGAEVCTTINRREVVAQDEGEKNEAYKSRLEGERLKMCEAKGCWWDNSVDKCRPEKGMCAGRTQLGCWLDSDCRWLNDACMFRAEKSSEKAYAEVAGICLCKNNVPVWDSKCEGDRNNFWEESIPGTCTQPLDNESIQVFCEQNASDLSPYGRDKCNKAIKNVIKAGEQSCLDNAEIQYQNSLKDVTAREERRSADALCRTGAEELYTGAVFSGSGLRGGALEAHKKLTKSISHESDLKVLILGWMTFALELTAVIAVVAIVWAGILYVTDMGDGSNQEKAKKIIMWVVIGILVILGSYAIVNTIMKADLGDEGRQASISTIYLS